MNYLSAQNPRLRRCQNIIETVTLSIICQEASAFLTAHRRGPNVTVANAIPLADLFFSFFAFVFGALVVFSVLKGRKVSTPFGIIGEEGKEPSDKSQAQSISIQNILNTPPLTEEQMDAIADRVSRRAEEARNELKDPDILYDVPDIPNRIVHVLKLRYEVEQKVKGIVLAWGGGWAGHSMAPFDVYFRYFSRFHLAPEKLQREVSDFMFFIQAVINEGFSPPDEVYLQAQYLASELVRELSIILSRTDFSKAG